MKLEIIQPYIAYANGIKLNFGYEEYCIKKTIENLKTFLKRQLTLEEENEAIHEIVDHVYVTGDDIETVITYATEKLIKLFVDKKLEENNG